MIENKLFVYYCEALDIYNVSDITLLCLQTCKCCRFSYMVLVVVTM